MAQDQTEYDQIEVDEKVKGLQMQLNTVSLNITETEENHKNYNFAEWVFNATFKDPFLWVFWYSSKILIFWKNMIFGKKLHELSIRHLKEEELERFTCLALSARPRVLWQNRNYIFRCEFDVHWKNSLESRQLRRERFTVRLTGWEKNLRGTAENLFKLCRVWRKKFRLSCPMLMF